MLDSLAILDYSLIFNLLPRKLIGQFKISRIAIDGNGRGTDMGSVFMRNSST